MGEKRRRKLTPGDLLKYLLKQETDVGFPDNFPNQMLITVIGCGEDVGKIMNSMKLVIPLHFISRKKDSKRCCDTTTTKSIHTKDESKRGSAFAFIFGVN